MKHIINTTVTKEAKEIYDSLPNRYKGKFVSDAIAEKYEREQGTNIIDNLIKRIEELENRVKELEGKK